MNNCPKNYIFLKKNLNFYVLHVYVLTRRRAISSLTWKALAEKEKKAFATWRNGNNEKSKISKKNTAPT